MLLGGGFIVFKYFHPENWGRFSPILTSIFFKGVGSTNQVADLWFEHQFEH